MRKNNKELMQKLLALTLTLTGLAASLSGCGNNKQKGEETTSTPVVETTQESTDEQLPTYFDTLKQSEQQEIKKMFEGLHIPSEFIKNDEIVSELLNVVLENKDYTSIVDFISYPTITEFYHTSDGKISFVKEKNELFIKKFIDNDMMIKLIIINKNGSTKEVINSTYCNENGSAFTNDTYISTNGAIVPKTASEVLYIVSTLYGDEKKTYYHFHHDDNCISFDDKSNLIRITSHSVEYYHQYVIEVADEEKKELMSNFKEHNHWLLVALENKLAEKYKDNYYEESHDCDLFFQNSDKAVNLSISKDVTGNLMSAYVCSDNDYIGDNDDDSYLDLRVDCMISDEQYNTLKKYMIEKDEKMITYIEQIDAEHKAAEATAKSGKQAKVYTKQ